MKMEAARETFLSKAKVGFMLAIVLLCAPLGFSQSQSQDQPSSNDKPAPQDQTKDSSKADAQSQSDKFKKSGDPATAKLKIHVTDSNDKPVGNASIYVRFNEPGGMFHHDKLSEMNFKTNQDGSVKVPDVPQGKILIQVVAKGLHTYGKWYDVDKEEESVEIKLEPAPHWY